MSRFYVSAGGQAKTEATRRGGTKSGVYSHTRGWHIGVRVNGHVNDAGEDEFDVYLTGGSRDAFGDRLIRTLTEKELTEPEKKIKVEVRGGAAYCDDPRVEIVDYDNQADDPCEDCRKYGETVCGNDTTNFSCFERR